MSCRKERAAGEPRPWPWFPQGASPACMHACRCTCAHPSTQPHLASTSTPPHPSTPPPSTPALGPTTVSPRTTTERQWPKPAAGSWQLATGNWQRPLASSWHHWKASDPATGPTSKGTQAPQAQDRLHARPRFSAASVPPTPTTQPQPDPGPDAQPRQFIVHVSFRFVVSILSCKPPHHIFDEAETPTLSASGPMPSCPWTNLTGKKLKKKEETKTSLAGTKKKAIGRLFCLFYPVNHALSDPHVALMSHFNSASVAYQPRDDDFAFFFQVLGFGFTLHFSWLFFMAQARATEKILAGIIHLCGSAARSRSARTIARLNDCTLARQEHHFGLQAKKEANQHSWGV